MRSAPNFRNRNRTRSPPIMLDIHRDDGPATKVYFSHSSLPSYIDPQNVSTKKKPFSTFNAQPFSHTVRPRRQPPAHIHCTKLM